jgi:TPR repeat protein
MKHLWLFLLFIFSTASFGQSISELQDKARGGDAESQYLLGTEYLLGEKIQQDLNQAAEWFHESAIQDYIYGQKWLGVCYHNGYGVSKNDEEAVKWLTLAYEQGDDESRDLIELITGRPIPQAPTFIAKIDWLSKDGVLITQDDVSSQEYEICFGVNSSSKIDFWRLYVNGKKVAYSNNHRGIGVGRNDGYDLTASRIIKLKPGVNTIELKIKNSDSRWATSLPLHVTYNSGQERRIALVVGNSNYKAEQALKNPKNDAIDVAQKLRSLGFFVITGIDVDRNNFNAKINEFGKEARSYDVALFYYAGHGMQNKGVNYLIPTDAILKEENEIEDKCIDADKVLRTLEEAKCKANILILDACRNNAFERSWHRGVAGGGLAAMSGPIGTFIAYSTSPGKVAKDGNVGDRNSPYTKALLHQLDVPNLSLAQFFENVLIEVDNATNHSQQPWTTSSFAGSFIFNKK